MSTTRAIYAGATLSSKYNGYTVQVLSVESSTGGVTVLASGQRVNTTERYLRALYTEV